jgi:hypothetical protein
MPSIKQLGKPWKYRCQRIFHCAPVVSDDNIRHTKILFSDNSIELFNRPGILVSDSPTRKQNARAKKEFIGEVPPKLSQKLRPS